MTGARALMCHDHVPPSGVRSPRKCAEAAGRSQGSCACAASVGCHSAATRAVAPACLSLGQRHSGGEWQGPQPVLSSGKSRLARFKPPPLLLCSIVTACRALPRHQKKERGPTPYIYILYLSARGASPSVGSRHLPTRGLAIGRLLCRSGRF